MRTCRTCGSNKSPSDYHRDRSRKDGLCSDCKECKKALSRAYYQANHARELARARAKQAAHPDYAKYQQQKMYRWRAANRERDRETAKKSMRIWRESHPELARAKWHARRAQVKSSPAIARRITALLKEPCAYCGATENMSIDHVIPLSRGGMHTEDNLLPACRSCNSSKGQKQLDEWSPLRAT